MDITILLCFSLTLSSITALIFYQLGKSKKQHRKFYILHNKKRFGITSNIEAAFSLQEAWEMEDETPTYIETDSILL